MTLQRIILHWSAGAAGNQAEDIDHYHHIVTRDGRRVQGKYRPEDNLSTADGRYAAHTLNCNTGSIGMAMDAMRGAVERPFSAGPEPITDAQLSAFVIWVAEVARAYGIPITQRTVLTHAEVQPTLGIAQRGKWDICWLPGMESPGDAVLVGNRLRSMIALADARR